jgi:hypothetical protein
MRRFLGPIVRSHGAPLALLIQPAPAMTPAAISLETGRAKEEEEAHESTD